jgi:hypothetical protein
MQLPLKAYRLAKIRMLERDFMVALKDEEKTHFETLKSEVAIDMYARAILQRHLN